MKRVFGITEAVFNGLYLVSALSLGLALILMRDSAVRTLAGMAAFVLAGGDSFHLIPRIRVAIGGQEKRWRKALGLGKQITSVTMTAFYLLLWQLGLKAFGVGSAGLWTYLVYLLAAVRIALCLLPQNQWQERYQPVDWGIWRNIPFFLQGLITAALFFLHRSLVPGMELMWLAIILSFVFYLPVVLWVNRIPKIGMLMLPKSCAYIWMLIMCLYL